MHPMSSCLAPSDLPGQIFFFRLDDPSLHVLVFPNLRDILQVLHWQFTTGQGRQPRTLTNLEESTTTLFRPGLEWQDVLVPALLVFLDEYREVRRDKALRHLCLQCLSQLATAGPSFAQPQQRMAYVQQFVQHLGQLFATVTLEATGQPLPQECKCLAARLNGLT